MNIRSAYLLSCLLISAPGPSWACQLLLLDSSSSEALISEVTADPALTHLYVRGPETSGIDPVYLRNVTRGLARAFIPWFTRSEDISYLKMLSRQHAITIYGREKFESGSTLYLGVDAPPDREVILPAGRGVILWPGLTRDKFGSSTIWIDLNDIAPPDCPLETQTEEREIPVPNIPAIVWPTQGPTVNFPSGKQSTLHEYPNEARIEPYLHRLGFLANRVRQSRNVLPVSDLIDALAEYYYVAIHAHPFYRVNSSIFMMQINYILNYRGLRGIAHGYLDFEALTSSEGFESFLPKFRDAIRENNADLN